MNEDLIQAKLDSLASDIQVLRSEILQQKSSDPRPLRQAHPSPDACPVSATGLDGNTELIVLLRYFHTRKMRNKVEIEFVTPLAGAFTKPEATRVLKDTEVNHMAKLMFKWAYFNLLLAGTWLGPPAMMFKGKVIAKRR